MRRFIDVHLEMEGLDQQTLATAHQRDLELETTEGVCFLHAWGDRTTGVRMPSPFLAIRAEDQGWQTNGMLVSFLREP